MNDVHIRLMADARVGHMAAYTAIMPALMPSRTVSVSIARPSNEVHAFIVAPENLPRWAAGLAQSVSRSGDGWVVKTPDGPMGISFAPPNAFGVADHRVTVRPGLEVLNPMRVLPNGEGSEVLFTVFQLPGVPDEAFMADVAAVERDLNTLKRVLEESAE
jgi:hypothetical protein